LCKAGTSVAAELLQWDHKVGSIKLGMIADIIAVKGNPLEDITNLRNIKVRFDKVEKLK
jgi:imidazolonepropionase-like amidohydrolase